MNELLALTHVVLLSQEVNRRPGHLIQPGWLHQASFLWAWKALRPASGARVTAVLLVVWIPGDRNRKISPLLWREDWEGKSAADCSPIHFVIKKSAAGQSAALCPRQFSSTKKGDASSGFSCETSDSDQQEVPYSSHFKKVCTGSLFCTVSTLKCWSWPVLSMCGSASAVQLVRPWVVRAEPADGSLYLY